jgi:hypothetical protein
MRRVTAVAVLSLSLAALCSHVSAQDARQRQAAAEAYDKGTAAYLDGSYEEAARWFETANRLAPAGPALMQAIRAHERNDNIARASTLALELSTSYHDDKASIDYAANVLAKHASSLVRIEVKCDEDCKLDLDGKLQDFLSFFVTPGVAHQLTATFETGSKRADFQGAAGETRGIQFEAPPPPPTPAIASLQDNEAAATSNAHRPLAPLFTWIGLGVTVALGAATIVSGLNAKAGVPDFEKAAAQSRDCIKNAASDCTQLQARARSLYDAGHGREIRTDVLIGATAVAAVGTGVIALLFTDWSGSTERVQTASLRFQVNPYPGGVMSVLEGRF